MSGDLKKRVIVQETFDDIVKENIEDLEMDPEEAIADAIESLEAQGVDLSNIVKDLTITDDGSSWHPILNVLDQLKTVDINDKPILLNLLKEFGSLCHKSIAHRCLAARKGSAFLTLMDLYSCLSNKESQVAVLEAFCQFIEGQPDLVTPNAMEMFIETAKHNHDELCLHGTRLIRLVSIMHEENRQALVSNNVIIALSEAMTNHRTSCPVVSEICRAFRNLTLDDDPRVPFGKAHDHAKMIVTDAGALELLLDVAKDHKDESVLGELFTTLGRLAVRNEFCQRIVDLGGLTLMLDCLQKNLGSKVVSTQIIGVFKAIAGNDEVKVALASSVAPHLIVQAMDQHQACEPLCANACSCLATIALRNPRNVATIMQCNGHIAIVQCMKIWPGSARVQKQGCLAIRNLVARNQEHCELILALGAEDIINESLQNKETHDEAKAALRDLGCKVELTERWTGAHGEIQY